MSTATIEAMHFTAKQVLDALEAAVKGKEGYIDPRAGSPEACQYLIDGVPSCIVGTALALLGVSKEVLHRMDCTGNPMFSADGYAALTGHGITMDEKAHGMLSRAQSRQDRSATWAQALEGAREVYEGTHSPHDL